MENKEPFKITVNQSQYEFSVQPQDASALDMVPDGESSFHILHNGRSYWAKLVKADYACRQLEVKVNDSTFHIHIADQYERLVRQLGLGVGGAQKQNILKAPMPGLVLQVMAAPGQTVSKGDPLLILEAMKMENVIKAANDGVVKNVTAQKGMAVEKGQVLLEME